MKRIIHQMEPWIGKEEEQEVLKVLRSGWITEAEATKKFENEIAKFVGSRYASVVTNGTVSLAIGLWALGVGAGDEVIVPDFTMVATPNSVVMTGAKPVFVDIEKETLCLNISDVEKKITSRTRVVMPVALNGRAPDMDRLVRLCRKKNIQLLEDAAQAFGSTWKNQWLGTFGEIGSYSFSTPKVITTGQGGALVTNDKKLYEKIIRIKDFGRLNRNTQDHDAIGYNFKFTDILAAVGIAQMKKLSNRLKRKKELFAVYQKELEGIKGIQFLATDLSQVSPWFIDILVDDPKALQSYLRLEGIGSREFYPAIHTTEPYRHFGVFPNSRWASDHGLWLPSSSFLTDSDIMTVCSLIRNYYER